MSAAALYSPRRIRAEHRSAAASGSFVSSPVSRLSATAGWSANNASLPRAARADGSLGLSSATRSKTRAASSRRASLSNAMPSESSRPGSSGWPTVSRSASRRLIWLSRYEASGCSHSALPERASPTHARTRAARPIQRRFMTASLPEKFVRRAQQDLGADREAPLVDVEARMVVVVDEPALLVARADRDEAARH